MATSVSRISQRLLDQHWYLLAQAIYRSERVLLLIIKINIISISSCSVETDSACCRE